jgi:hypothetical protein
MMIAAVAALERGCFSPELPGKIVVDRQASRAAGDHVLARRHSFGQASLFPRSLAGTADVRAHARRTAGTEAAD